MTFDPISDFLTQLRNAYMARLDFVVVPHSKMRETIAHILKSEGYVGEVTVAEDNGRKSLHVGLLYHGNAPAITTIKRISKPSRRVYVDRTNIPRPLRGIGMAIVSTSGGVLSGKDARKKGLGGEIVCEVW